MSPEQARGEKVDKRADIWSFGVVVYEMVTGTRAFAGDDVADVLASVLAREPDWTRLPSNLSPALGTYIRRCLEKNPKQRIADAQDMRLALEGAFDTAAVAVRATCRDAHGERVGGRRPGCRRRGGRRGRVGRHTPASATAASCLAAAGRAALVPPR